jgi:hypothetical protein
MNRANRPRLSRISGSSYASKLMSRASDEPTLSLDFTTGVLDPRLTFSRTTNATFINSSGFVQYAFANRIPNSASLSSFTPNGVTATADPTEPGPVIAPAGTQATKFTVNVGATTVSVPLNFGAGAGTATGMTYSLYLKPSRINNGSGFRYAIRNETTSLNTYGVDVIWTNNPVTVTEVIGAADGNNQLIGPDANGWYRLILTVTNTSLIRPGDNMTVYAGYSGQGSGFFDTLGAYWVWGAQFEPGVTASPVFLTGATSTGYFNTPRFDHDPTTNALRGLLLEATATNLLNWSSAFATSGGTNNNWADTNITRTTGQADPANGTTAIRFAASAGNATVISSAAIGTSAQRTFSIWLRRVTGSGNIQFTTDNGSTWTTQAITASWVRYVFPATTAAQHVGVRIVDSGDAIEMWGAQLEIGSTASSHLPTGPSQITRSAEFCLMTGTNFSSWYQGGTQGTFYADWFGGVREGATGNTNRTVLSTDDVSTKHLHLLQTAAAGNLRVADFGGANNVTTANTLTSGARTKGAFGYNGSSASVCLNGGTVATGSSLAFSVTPTWLVLGATSTNGTSLTDANVVLNNSIRQIQYWPTRLADGTLQGLTT